MAASHDLEKEPIGKLLISLAVPAIVSQLVNLLYNMVDRIFIGKMADGDLAMAGLGVSLPILTIVAAFAQLFGTGGAPLCAIKMGQKDNDAAEKIMTNSFSTLLVSGALLTLFILFFREPLLSLFGADGETLPYAMSYVGIYAFGTIFVQITMGMNPYINSQGFAKIGMFTVVIGAVLNIILDPIFIFGFGMGVSGAALATVFSQMVSGIWVLVFLFGKKSILKIRKRYLIPNLKIVWSITALGISPFIMQATESLVQISFNNQLGKYGGNVAVGGITIMYSLMTFVTLPISGLAQGGAPIISYNYGAGRIDRVKKTFHCVFISCFVISFLAAMAIMVFSRQFAGIFIKEGPILEFTARALRIFLVGMTVFGFQIACQNTFMALGQAKISLMMALLRKVVLLVPLIYLLPLFLEDKVNAILMAEPIADITAATVTTICFFVFYQRVLTNKAEKKEKAADAAE